MEFHLQAIAGLYSGSSGGFCTVHPGILTAELHAAFWHVEIATFSAQNLLGCYHKQPPQQQQLLEPCLSWLIS